MTPTVTLTLADGVRIVVPDALDQVTPYVLREQLDWFEDEIKFLRRALQPGQKAIDIGASYGVYTLSMARCVGARGRVWAFEPAAGPAALLARSIAENGFDQVRIEPCALSSESGRARLSVGRDLESSMLIHGASPETDGSVAVLTLDEYLLRGEWQDVDFVKIDAEGEEENILRGGARFFAQCSPLVQYEVKAGADLHLGLVRAFAALGYAAYRLVPGPGLLAPFDSDAPLDEFLLNLFACRPERAAALAARGLLVEAGAAIPRRLELALPADRRESIYHWRRCLARLPYGAQLSGLWEKAVGDADAVAEPLAGYAASRDASLSAAQRVDALRASFERLQALCEREPSHMRLASLARVARDYGARAVAASALLRLSQAIVAQRHVDPSEPFLAPSERFDTIPPGKALANWILAAALEEFERNVAFSSFYTGISAQPRLETIRKLGFGSLEMERRLSLVQQRFG